MKITSEFLFKLIFELSKKDTLSFIKELEFNKQEECLELFQKIVLEFEKNSNVNFSKIEGQLKQNLSPKILKYYRVNKSKLKKDLLDFLNKKHLEIDNRFLLRGQIHTGVTLAELGHNLEGLKLIEEAIVEAKKNEFFEEILFALEKLRRYKPEIRSKSTTALAFNNEFKHYQNILNNLNDYINLSFYIFSFQQDFSSNLNTIHTLKNHELLIDENKALSLSAKKFYYLGRLDILNALKEYDEMFDIVIEAVAYAEKANQENEIFATTLISMYERLEYVSTHLQKYDISIKAIESMENFVVPAMYERSLIFYRLMNVSPKVKRLHIYSTTENEKLFPYCLELEKDLKKLKIGTIDSRGIYYNILFNYTVKLSRHKEACILGKEYVKFAIDNVDGINPLNNQTIQSFLCYMISAYVNYTEDTFEYLFEYLFKKKNAILFVGEDAPFSYVFKLYNVFMKAFKDDFYSEEVLTQYYDIWKEFPNFLPKANCIPKAVFKKEYKEEVVKSISVKYDAVKFEC